MAHLVLPASTLVDLGVTASAAELNVLDGLTASTAELNYVGGVTSSIQDQLDVLTAADVMLHDEAEAETTNRVNADAALLSAIDGKAPLSHTHVIADTTGLQTALDGKQPIDAALTALAGGSDYTQFVGPTTSVKQYTLRDASTNIVTAPSALVATQVPYTNANGELVSRSTFTFSSDILIVDIGGFRSTYGGASRVIMDPNATGNAGRVLVYNTSSNVQHNLDGNGSVTFNEQGADADFRVESDTLTQALLLDGTTGFLGVGAGTIDPLYSLDVRTNNGTNAVIHLSPSATADTGMYIQTVSSAPYITSNAHYNGTNWIAKATSAATFGFNGNGFSFTMNPSGLTAGNPFTPTEYFALTPTATIFNENGAATDFRVESDTQTHMLYVDGTNNRMSIGGSTNGGYTLQVNGTLYATGAITGAGGLMLNSSNGFTLSSNFNWVWGGITVALISSTKFQFNVPGADQDFQIGGDTDANCFYLDASQDAIGIGVATPSASAKFQIDSTTKGMLPPRHTSVQRAAVSAPPEGLFVHDTTDYHSYVRSNAAWRRIAFTIDNYFGTNAFAVNTSYAFGDSYTTDTYELAFGVSQSNFTKPQFKLKKQGLFHYPDEGWGNSLDRWTQNVTLSVITGDATSTPMNVDELIGSGDGIDIPTDYAAAFDGLVVGADNTTGDVATYQIKGQIKNVGGTTTLTAGTVTVINEDDNTWDVTLAADNTNDELEINVVGDATNQVRWTATVRLVFTPITNFSM